jgi:hypothetical protein
MKLFPLLKIYPANRRLIQENIEVGELFDLVNTAQKIMMLDREEVIRVLIAACTQYRKQSDRVGKIQRSHSVLARVCTYKLAGKKLLIRSCMELLCPIMNKIVQGALNEYMTSRRRHANRRVIIYN